MTDEDKIRDVLEQWRRATAAGNVSDLLPLMADDVVFLAAGQPALRGRDAFASHLRAALEKVRLEPSGETREIRVDGSLGYCWSEVALTLKPHGLPSVQKLVGQDLTILRREADGRWVVFRSASMLVPQQLG
jgi:uncharacterized protein (TIGR02246 family)